jgi:hypothetical protein
MHGSMNVKCKDGNYIDDYDYDGDDDDNNNNKPT